MPVNLTRAGDFRRGDNVKNTHTKKKLVISIVSLGCLYVEATLGPSSRDVEWCFK